MLRRPWRTVLGTAAFVGSSAYVYHRVTRPKSIPQETFDLQAPAVGPDGKRSYTTQTIRILPMSDVDARLKQNATLRASTRPGNITWKHATTHLASNDPIEDAHAEAIAQRDQQDGDYLFFAVMDGHSGTHTSRLLSSTLIPAVALQLRELVNSTSFNTKSGQTSILDSIRTLFFSAPKSAGTQNLPYDADPKFVALAIQTAFAMLDAEIVNAPLRLLYDHLKEIGAKSNDSLPDLSKHPMALPSMAPAVSGSCALLALLDTAHRDLYVACTGDCRAVAGVWEESLGGPGNGIWRVDVLTDDQTGRNPSELKRLQSEHPKDEGSTVVQRGRILGGLEPSRAFGDARYKWPLHIQQILSRVYMEGNDKPLRRPPPDFKTPPYVTAHPVVTYRKLDFLPLSDYSPMSFPSPVTNDTASSSSSTPSTFSRVLEYVPFTSKSPSEQQQTRIENNTNTSFESSLQQTPSSSLRFIILATDGLWDRISSQDAVQLVGAHLSGLRAPTISRSALHTYAPTRLGDSAGVEGKGRPKQPSSSSNNNGNNSSQPQSQPQKDEPPAWTFTDSHPGVHLIRNAFGGADQLRLRKLLSIPPPLSRRFRDDVTVTVVWWEDGRVGEPRVEDVKLKAKL